MADYRAKVTLGEALVPVGQLRFTRAGPRQFSSFAYDQAWVDNPRHFDLSPDMPLEGGPLHASAQHGEQRDALSGVLPMRRRTAGADGCSNAIMGMA